MKFNYSFKIISCYYQYLDDALINYNFLPFILENTNSQFIVNWYNYIELK
jgi:hypothetical protein